MPAAALRACPASMRCSLPTICRRACATRRRCRCCCRIRQSRRDAHAALRWRATRSVTSAKRIAVVIADNRYIAEDAAAAVDGRLRRAAGGERRRDAVKPGAPRVHSDLRSNIAPVVPMSYGDVDAAFASAPHVFEEEIWPASRRRHDAGRPRRARDATMPRPTCSPSGRRRRRRISAARTLADLFERDLESIRVIAPDRRRRLRHQGAVLRRGGGDPGGSDEARPPGEMDRGPARAFLSRHPGARPVLEGRDRGRWRRQDPRRCAAPCCTTPAPIMPWGIVDALHRRDDGARPLCRAGLRARTSRSRSPTRCRPRRCAAPAGRRRCSPWSG